MRWRRWLPANRSPDSRPDHLAHPASDEAAEPPAEDRWVRLRERMVGEQIEARGLTDPELLRTFRTVPRHAFVASEDPYSDRALGIGSGQTISQPYVVAAMTAQARPPGGWREARVLEIGTGSGYGAAILAELGAQVVTMERHAPLAAQAAECLRGAGYPGVRVVVGDGTAGFPDAAPYDAILVTAAGPEIPRPLLDQLSTHGGRLVMPVGTRDQQWLTVVERQGDALTQRATEPVVFVPLVGEHGFRS
jgi:protein-L-isoaspartate(D-aspartate) O-methyltransferase